MTDRPKSHSAQKNAATSDKLRRTRVPPQGAEQSRDLAENSSSCRQGDALSDARRDDWRLLALVEAWPRLPEDVKGRIAEFLILAGAVPLADAGRGASDLRE